MATVRQDKVQISVEIDGKPVQNTIADLQKSYRQLNREIQNLTPGTEAFNKKAQELAKVKGYLNDARDAANSFGQQQTKLQALMGKFGGLMGNLGGQFGQIGGLLKGIGGGAALTATGVGAAAAAIAKGSDAVIQITKEFSKLRNEVNALTGATGPQLDALTGQIKGVADTFDQDFNEVLKAANTVSKTFGISINEAIAQISDGFIAGADASGEYLNILTEYPAQLETVGLSFEEANALILKQTQEGIFSDKGIDAIKEAGLRLRELPKATREALDGIGLAADEVEAGLRDGSTTLFDVIQQVGGRLGELEANSPEVGAAIADIFGGPGEDAGLEYLRTLGKVEGGLDSISKVSADQQRRLEEELRVTQELSTAKAELASKFEDIVASGGNFITKVQIFLIQGFNKMVDLFGPLIDEFKSLFNIFRAGAEETDGLGKKTSTLEAIMNALLFPLRIFIKLQTTIISVVRSVVEWFARLYNESTFLKAVIAGLTTPIRALIAFFGNLEASIAAINAVLQGVAQNIKTFINETILDLRIAAKEVENFFSFSESTEKELQALRSQKGAYADAYVDLGKAAANAYNQALEENAKAVPDIPPEERKKKTGTGQNTGDEGNGLTEEEKAKLAKEAEAERKERERLQIEMQKYLQDLELQLMDESLEKRIMQINLQTDREIAGLQGSAEQVATATRLLNERRQKQISEAEEKFRKEEEAKRKAEQQKALSEQEKEQQAQLEALEAYHKQRTAEITIQTAEEAQAGAFTTREEAEKVMQDRMLAQLRSYLQERIALMRQYGMDVSDLEAELAQMSLDGAFGGGEDGEGDLPEWYDKLVSGLDAARQVISAYFDFAAQEAQQRYDTETEAMEEAKAKELNAAANNARLREQIEEKYQKKKDSLDKAFRQQEKNRAITQSVIDTALAVVKALGTPPSPNVAAAAIAGSLGAIQTATIATETYADGGFTGPGMGYPDHTGYKPAGIVHQDEYVAPAWQVKSPVYRPLINALEVGRLRGYATGGPVTPVTPSNSAVSAAGGRQTMDVLREEIAGLRQDLGRIQFVMPIDEAMADLVSRRQSDLSSRRSNNAI